VYILRHSDQNDVIFFAYFKNISVYGQKNRAEVWVLFEQLYTPLSLSVP